MIKRLSTLLFIVAVCITAAQAQLSLPIRMIGGQKFYYRTVEKKETLYGISKELGMTTADIIKYNPTAASGLKKGQTLYFPAADFIKPIIKKPTAYTHTAQKGETLYRIARTYGTTVKDLIAANPELHAGLKSGQTIRIPAAKNTKKRPYVIQKGETAYRVSKNFGITIEELLAANPGLSPEKFRAGDTILIPAAQSTTAEEKKPSATIVTAKVEKGDTFASIAQRHGSTEETVRDANPDMKNPKKGKTVYIPILAKEEEEPDSEKVATLYNQVHDISKSDSLRVSLILPLELTANQSRQANLYTDFYRGFLMAVNEMTKDSGNLQVNVFDTATTPLTEILADKRISRSDIIFAPHDKTALQTIAEFGEKHNINVINAFSVGSDLYYDNDHFFQINTPSETMYASAAKAIADKRSNGYRIVCIKDSASAEKPLLNYLKKDVEDLQYIDAEDLENAEMLQMLLPHDKTIVFVPTSASKNFLKHIQPALTRLKNDGIYRFSLFGYPEWTGYAEYYPFFKKVNTTVFSRYAIINSDKATKEFNTRFKYWYGEKPLKSVPEMAPLGYDLGSYFIRTGKATHNDFNMQTSDFNGLQTALSMQRVSNWGGFVNSAIYLINYAPSGTTTKSVIR